MKAKTIKGIMKNMTTKELTEHQDLINECLDREKSNKKCSKRTAENLENLNKIFDEIKNNVDKINLLNQKTGERIH